MSVITNDWLYFYNRYFYDLGKVIYKNEYTYNTVKQILRFLEGQYEASILDLGCGYGRLTVPLAKKGLNIDGVDSATHLLNIAKQEASEAEITSNFYEQDIRYLELDKRYDLIISMGHSIGFYDTDEEDQLIFQRAAGHLTEDGYFILEIHNRDAFIRKYRPEEKVELPMGDIFMQLERTYNMLQGKGGYRFSWEEHGEAFAADLDFRVYAITEVVAMLKQAGLEVFKITGADGNELSLNTDSVILYAQKK